MMTAKELIERFTCRGLKLIYTQGQLKIQSPKGVVTDDEIDSVRKLKTEIISCE